MHDLAVLVAPPGTRADVFKVAVAAQTQFADRRVARRFISQPVKYLAETEVVADKNQQL